jgi:hypothetical protein
MWSGYWNCYGYLSRSSKGIEFTLQVHLDQCLNILPIPLCIVDFVVAWNTYSLYAAAIFLGYEILLHSLNYNFYIWPSLLPRAIRNSEYLLCYSFFVVPSNMNWGFMFFYLSYRLSEWWRQQCAGREHFLVSPSDDFSLFTVSILVVQIIISWFHQGTTSQFFSVSILVVQIIICKD